METDDLQCAVCYEIMIRPMVLRCGHSFCELCAEESINFNDKCPICRQKTVGICIYNRALDSCIQTWLRRQSPNLCSAHAKRRTLNTKILSLKTSARMILWTVVSRSNHETINIDDVEQLYNAIQTEQKGQMIEFGEDLKAQIRHEAHLHDGYLFKIYHSDNCSPLRVRLLDGSTGARNHAIQ